MFENLSDQVRRRFRKAEECAGTPRIAPAEPGNTGHDVGHRKNELIAIVDDDEYALSGLEDLIESAGYKAATFVSAEDYFAADLVECPVCLILDVHLPGMSGPDLQADLVAAARCPPTVFVTGRLEEHVRKRVTEAGALGYLLKPCNAEALLHCIGRVVRAAA